MGPTGKNIISTPKGLEGAKETTDVGKKDVGSILHHTKLHGTL